MTFNMEILDLKQFNERLNIQPISKERLKNTKTPKRLLQSGDFVVIDIDFSPSTKNIPYVYISKEDCNEHYPSKIGMFGEEYSDGGFVAYSKKQSRFITMPLSRFDINLVDTKSFTIKKVMSIYRGKSEQPYPSVYFIDPPINRDDMELIWQRDK